MDEFLERIMEIRFADVDDLYNRRAEIHEKYMKLDLATKQIYKWYFFYELCLLRNPLKRLLWDYLNNPTMANVELIFEYKLFCKKRKKYNVSEFDT